MSNRCVYLLFLWCVHGLSLPHGRQEYSSQNMFIISRDAEVVSHEIENDVDFLLWTRDNPTGQDHIKIGDLPGLGQTHFNNSLPTKVLVHGYGDTGITGWIKRVRDAYLSKENCNVISVDWQKLANTDPLYNIAAANSKPVGYLTADLINFLVESGGADLSSFHPVGFSLGAQVTGHLGYKLGGKLERITGLDPAGFLFHTVPASERLDKSDASFVDVMHTAGLWIGTDEVVGHVDFYPNKGQHPQPGCENEGLGLDCSHQRAPALFAESITSDVGFKSYKCTSWDEFNDDNCDTSAVETNLMGEPANPSNPGVFYLRTNAVSPFAIQNLNTIPNELKLSE